MALISSSLMAIAGTILIAMGPIITTSAIDNIRSDSINASTEQVQNLQSVFFEQEVETNKCTVTIKAINTKGVQGFFDKIMLYAFGYDFEVIDIFDTSIKVLGSDGIKEPLNTYFEVRTETMYKGKLATFNFTDPYVGAYVKALVEHEANSSTLIIKPQDFLYIMDFARHDIGLPKGNDIEFIQSEYSQSEAVYYGECISSLTRDVQGSHDNYKVRFYDIDGDVNTYERITIQKKQDPEFIVEFLGECFLEKESVDYKSEAGSLVYIHLNHNNRIVSSNIIFDDDLGHFLIEMTKAKNANTTHPEDPYNNHIKVNIDNNHFKIKR